MQLPMRQLQQCSVHDSSLKACRRVSGGAQKRLVSLQSSSSTSQPQPQQQQPPHKLQQQQPPPAQQYLQYAAASGAAVILSPVAYNVLSTCDLPPVDLLLELAGGAAAAALGVVKALHGDNIHLEWHKGQLYVQLGVPKLGPAITPNSIVTRPTGDARGNGAYATRTIPAGTHIADYTGELLSNAAFFQRYPDGVGDYVMAIDRDFVIDAAAWVADTADFHPVHMNHSRTRPNVVRFYQRSKGRVAFFASRDIQPGEELLYNYGNAYWRGREHLELP